MRSIEKLTAAMFPDVYSSLLHPFDPQMPEATWQRAFVLNRWHDEDHFGYVLRDEGKFVGMLGALFSRRQVDGREVRFCNLHNWYVRPEFRAQSLLLMRPILALKDHVVTDLSASSEVVAISARLGFTKLDRTIRMLPRLPWRSSASDVLHLDTEAAAAEKLTSAELQLFRDHQGIDCQHLFVASDEGDCYIIASRIKSRWLPHVFVHHLNNPQVFARQSLQIRHHLLQSGGRYVAVNVPHLAGQKVPYSLLADANQRLVRGIHCPPSAIDSLYSEMPLFKLPIYPRPPLFVRGTALRMWRWKNSCAEWLKSWHSASENGLRSC
ncbi:GNAT family N-acetyltransferase [Anatilimnocola sp. NA78]|uniref:GNAT family N-acetyltransferase n=1 Tax=Anatilimnocola sp. NA78 TaxID=3415683 RepID=UPI003CE57C00